jgi:hypothetical protein
VAPLAFELAPVPVPVVVPVTVRAPAPVVPVLAAPVPGCFAAEPAVVGVPVPAGVVVAPAPGVAFGVLVPVVAAPGAVVPAVGAVATVVVGAVVAGAPATEFAPAPVAPAAAGVVTLGIAGPTAPLAVELAELPARETSATLNAPSESTITALNTITGVRQLGIAARRVRAAAPHRRHHS